MLKRKKKKSCLSTTARRESHLFRTKKHKIHTISALEKRQAPNQPPDRFSHILYNARHRSKHQNVYVNPLYFAAAPNPPTLLPKHPRETKISLPTECARGFRASNACFEPFAFIFDRSTVCVTRGSLASSYCSFESIYVQQTIYTMMTEPTHSPAKATKKGDQLTPQEKSKNITYR